jgi:hypothetical protein
MYARLPSDKGLCLLKNPYRSSLGSITVKQIVTGVEVDRLSVLPSP